MWILTQILECESPIEIVGLADTLTCSHDFFNVHNRTLTESLFLAAMSASVKVNFFATD